MNDQEAERALAFDTKFAESHLLVRGDLMPMAVFRCANKTASVMPLIGAKEYCYRLLTVAAIAFDATAVTVLTEAWMARVAQDEIEERDGGYFMKGKSAAARENRQEVVVAAIAHRTANGKIAQLIRCRTIQRDDDGRVTGLGPPDAVASTTVRMRIAHVLPPVRPSDKMRQRAADALIALGLEAKTIHPAGHA
jgi:hypothetical protein